ncbi:MAG TPA: DeoR/GlpR family DNA-binding transcription regulator [Candidatus Hydrogenedentes bacterium]|nr:DeoR/GlpR family DNA-binding transcription regulator [Candidatus Hydrogenedentota bacterium]HOS01836.1 DeoR/GlpR family DNA-binding transcription regulator [Candidatus Hydrogenedentota bacterium]
MQRVLIPERWENIIRLVEKQGGATIEEIAQEIGVSPATVRRDLTHIHARGLIERTRGGAAPGRHVRTGPTLAESRKINPVEKERIGRVAASLVKPNDLVVFDGGFTTCQVARHMTASGVTVITNSLDIVQATIGRNDVTLVLIGGEVCLETGTTVGPQAENMLTHLSAGKAILGADAVSPEEGLSSPISSTAQTKKAMAECARELIVVADYSKLGEFALYRVAPVSAITTLVTDDKAEPKLLDAFRDAGVEVIVATSEE